MKQIPGLYDDHSHPTFFTQQNKMVKPVSLYGQTYEVNKHNTHVDGKVLEAFKATGDGWEKRINKILRDALAD